MNFQQCPQTLQFQRYGRAARHSVGGIACDIHGKLTGRDSCATTHSTASSTAGSAATGAGGGLAQRPGTVDTVAANDLPKPHRDRSRDHAQTHNLTTTSNTNFPAPTSRKVTIRPTRCALSPGRLPLTRPGNTKTSALRRKRGGYARRRRDLNPRGAMHPYLLSREAHSTGLCDVSSADYFRAFSPRARTCARRDARGRPARRRARDSNPRCHC